MINKPYVKEYDSLTLLNPITNYYHQHDNRRSRREKPERFTNNRKTHHLTIFKNSKFRRHTQIIYLKDKDGIFTGEINTVLHYLSR